MVAREILLLEGFNGPEGNKLLDAFEKHTGLVGDPLPDSQSRLYHLPVESHDEAETFISEVFEEHLRERHWRERLKIGVEGLG